jgi:hypothetical protein
MRRISNVYTPNNSNVDVAILKVDLPFVFINFIQGITLAPAGFIPPGNKLLIYVWIKAKSLGELCSSPYLSP